MCQVFVSQLFPHKGRLIAISPPIGDYNQVVDDFSKRLSLSLEGAMEMADTTKLNLLGEGGGGLEGKMGTQKISVLDHMNRYNYASEKSDSFVIDMEGFSHGSTVSKDPILSPSPRITLQRSVSRKGSSQRTNNNSPADRDSVVPTSSPRGPSTPEKGAATTAAGTADHSTNPQTHHQITISTGNINSAAEGRCTMRRNSFKRYPTTWVLDPRRVLFFFATLSSLGTLLLIYFTLSMGKMSTHENTLD